VHLLTTNQIFTHDFKIYPNPSNGELNIIFDKLQNEGRLEIFDLSGQLMYLKNLQPGNKINSINATNLSTGVYLVKFAGQNAKSITKKWMKL